MTIDELIDAARNGSIRAAGRLLSLVESPRRGEVLDALGAAPAPRVVGVTGPPGAGKSTTVGALVGAYREREKRVAVLAVDPSSPYSGGALLGDRIRMAAHINDSDVLIRSVATRGHLGGLAAAVPAAIRLLAALSYDLVVLETCRCRAVRDRDRRHRRPDDRPPQPRRGRRGAGRQGGSAGGRRHRGRQQGGSRGRGSDGAGPAGRDQGADPETRCRRRAGHPRAGRGHRGASSRRQPGTPQGPRTLADPVAGADATTQPSRSGPPGGVGRRRSLRSLQPRPRSCSPSRSSPSRWQGRQRGMATRSPCRRCCARARRNGVARSATSRRRGCTRRGTRPR